MKEKIRKLKSGIEISYFDSESDLPPLIFIHGLGSNKKAFSRNWDYLRKHFRIFALDLPNYGNSSRGEFLSTVQFFSDVLKEFLIGLDLGFVFLCGHSMGGEIAIYLASNFPELVKKLVLIAPSGLETFSSEEKIKLKQFFSCHNIKNATDEIIRRNVEMNFYSFPEEAEFIITERIMLRDKPHFRYYCQTVENAFSSIIETPVIDYLKSIRISTLIIFGKNDKFIPNKNFNSSTTETFYNSLKIENPSISLIFIDECGHFVQFEKPEEFNNAILVFLSQSSVGEDL